MADETRLGVDHGSHATDYFMHVARRIIPGQLVVHKFGRNSAVGTTMVPIAMGGVYPAPQVTGAKTLRVKAGGNANDAAAGTGARAVTVYGIGTDGSEVFDTLATNGVSAGAAGTTEFIRVYRAWVSSAGAYSDLTMGSHNANIVIEASDGSADWLTIDYTSDTFAIGQSEIAAYTVPLGYEAYLKSVLITVDSNKTADLIFARRSGILKTSAPYNAVRSQLTFSGVTGSVPFNPATPMGPFPELTDLIWFGKVGATTGEINIDFELILRSTT